MALIKYLFEILLVTVIIFFVWNIMKRLFFRPFYKFPEKKRETETTIHQTSGKNSLNLNWDAETVEFEELKEEEKGKNKN